MTTTHRLEIDIEDRAGNKIGEGPLTNVPYVRYSRELGAAGFFETLLPLRDERTSLIEEKSHVLRFRWNGDVVFVGVVESTGATVTNGNALMMPVSGRCLGAELSEAKIGFLELTNGSGAGVTDGPQDILTAADTFTPSTWTLDTDDGYSTTSTAVYAKFAGESALQALRKVANKIGEHWRFHPTERKIVWMRNDTPDSGIRLIQGAPDLVTAESNPLIAFYDSFTEEKDCAGLFNRIYPYGGGAFEIAVTLNSTTRTATSGFTLSATNNYLQNDTSISDIGITIPLYMQFPDIRPVSNTDADIVSAANALFDAAETALIRNDTVSDFRVFKLGNVVKLPSDVVCGSTVRLVYEDERYNVDADFIVLAIDTHIAQDASVTYGLTVATVDAMPSSGTESIVNSMEDGRVFQTHPVLNVNYYERSFRVFVGENQTTEKAEIRFWFGDHVAQLQQVLWRFNLTELVAVTNTVGGTVVAGTTGGGGGTTATSASGGGATVTSASGGSSTPTSSSNGGNHVHTIPVVNGTSGTPVYYNSGGGYLEASGGGSFVSNNFNIDHTHTVTIAAHTHDVTVSSHTHDVTIPDHTHSVSVDVGSALSEDFGIYRESGSNTFAITDLEYQVNSGGYTDLSTDATDHGGGWYSVDLTAELYDANFRPNSTSNTIDIRRKSAGATGKTAMLDGALEVRQIIQSTAVS